MVKPFLKAILFALVMGYIFSPVNRWLKDKLKRKNLAAAITLILIILIALVPTVFLAKTLIEESYSTYIIAKQKVTSLNICEGDGFFCGA